MEERHQQVEKIEISRQVRYVKFLMDPKPQNLRRAMAQLAKRLVANCMRMPLEKYHLGRHPITHTGDYSDVRIIDAEGREFPMSEMGRITDPEMKDLMRYVVDRTYTFLMNYDDPEFAEMMARLDASTKKWDAPKLDEGMLSRKYVRALEELKQPKRQSQQSV